MMLFLRILALMLLSTPANAEQFKVVLQNEAGEQITRDDIYYDTDLGCPDPSLPATVQDCAGGLVAADMDVWFGPAARVGDEELPAFRWFNAAGKVYTRSGLFQEIGDSVDIGSGRAGPDGAVPGDPLGTTAPGTRMSRFYGRSYVVGPGWNGGPNGDQFALNGEMTVDTAPGHEQTATSRPGWLCLRTTRPGHIGPTDALCGDEFQRIRVVRGGDASPSVILYNKNGQHSGVGVLDLGSSRLLDFYVDGVVAVSYRGPDSLGLNRAGLAIRYRSADGTVRFEEIRVDNDGFLKVPLP